MLSFFQDFHSRVKMPASKPLRDDDVTINQIAIEQAGVRTQGCFVLQSFVGDDYSDDEPVPDETAKEEEDFEDFGGDLYVLHCR